MSVRYRGQKTNVCVCILGDVPESVSPEKSSTGIMCLNKHLLLVFSSRLVNLCRLCSVKALSTQRYETSDTRVTLAHLFQLLPVTQQTLGDAEEDH